MSTNATIVKRIQTNYSYVKGKPMNDKERPKLNEKMAALEVLEIVERDLNGILWVIHPDETMPRPAPDYTHPKTGYNHVARVMEKLSREEYCRYLNALHGGKFITLSVNLLYDDRSKTPEQMSTAIVAATKGRECKTCVKYKGRMAPSHNGSPNCESGSIASGGSKAHCSCDICF